MCKQVKASLMSHIIPYTALKTNSKIIKPKKSSMGILILIRRLFTCVITIALIFLIWKVVEFNKFLDSQTTIIIITPTHKRPERFADMTRFSQTLMHIKNIHWIVIEDDNKTVPAMERILQRSKIPYTYFFTTTMPGYPSKIFKFKIVRLWVFN